MGRTLLATTNGFTFTASRNYDNGVSVRVSAPYSNPFFMDFAAPGNVRLTTGDYDEVTRYPFETAAQGGLNFSAYGNGDNTLTGYFSVLEVSYGSGNTILSFAADFMQYDDGALDAWNQGSIRFHSAIEVPEPDTASLLLSAITAGFVSFRCRRLGRPAEPGTCTGRRDSASVT
jgi:hypothetical protein